MVGDPGWSGYVGILRPKSNKSSRMLLGLHMGCIRSLFNVLYRFKIFFSISENCFGKLVRSSNQEKSLEGVAGPVMFIIQSQRRIKAQECV